MDCCENLRRAVEFRCPEWVPILFGSKGVNDSHWVGFAQPSGWKPAVPNEDEWGCIWEKPPEGSNVVNMGQPRGHPLKSWDLFDQMKWPDPDAPGRFDNLAEQLSKAGDKYVVAGCGFTLFERMHYMRGMAELMVDMYECPDRVHELADRILDIQIGFIRNYAKYGRGRIHAVAMTDDWGTQNTHFISIPMFRKFFKERYRRLFRAIHDGGMHAWMHSCGHVNEIIQEWIDVGLDIVNLQQPRNLGIEEIGRRYAGKICFVTTVDIQATLPWKTPAEVRAEAKLLLECWGTPKGGFIVGEYGDPRAIGATEENGQAMFEAFMELGRHPAWKKPSA